MTVPKPPGFDAQTSANAWTEHVLKPDGSSYGAFSRFPGWKRWVDSLRDTIASQEVQLADHKKDLDRDQAQIVNLQNRVAALEAQPSRPFPASG